MGIEVRPARVEDEGAILALVRSERMRPTGLDWRRFHVACEGGEVIGTVQLRPVGPELASLVVRPDRRGRGLARALIESRLGGVAGPVFLVAPRVLAGLYQRHGFVQRRPLEVPWPIRVDWALAQGLGTLNSLSRGRRPRRMIVMARP